MIIKIFLKIFFALPTWLLKCLTLQKKIIVNNQILDYQTQIFLGLLSLQNNSFEDPDSHNSIEDLREKVENGRSDLPLNAKPREHIKTIDHCIEKDWGRLMIREYLPEKLQSNTIILYFHGGGYVVSSVNTHDAWVKLLSSNLKARVFSLEYRLAPENKFPLALEDANSAIEWISKEKNIPISEISLCGDSAGGHLAASLSTFRSLNNFELPHSQCLIYPMTDPLCNSKSQVEFSKGFFLGQNFMIWFWKQLMASDNNHADPTFNLTIDPDVALPKTLIITVGFDPLCDEGEAYARQINNSGNYVEQIHYPHLIHGFVNLTALNSAKIAALDIIKSYKNFI